MYKIFILRSLNILKNMQAQLHTIIGDNMSRWNSQGALTFNPIFTLKETADLKGVFAKNEGGL